ncbi:acyl-CoA dehydrogenase family protein [Streptomyces sp. NPDC057654]|uniref:acyl-CoA dehydrogenase family protein n=1 Tax=Streptomyces sp. NPDC057654 TaxID=3346196 RepID=UPI0036978B92
MTEPDLLYSEAEADLRSAVRSLLADRAAPAAVLAHSETDRPYDAALWRVLAAEMGTAGLLVPEKLGGQGAGARETAVVLEELGRTVAPVPYLTSAVLAVSALLACDTGQDVVAEPLRALAEGRRVGALAVPLPAAPGTPPPVTVRADAAGTLSGGVDTVAGAAGADLLLVRADGGLFAVDVADATSESVRVTGITPLDRTRPLSRVTLAGAPARRIAGEERATAAVDAALLAGAGLLASEQLGLAEWCLTETVRYAGERYQFGRPIGSFQAIKHRLAELWLQVASARASARNAADALAAHGAGGAETGSTDTAVAVAVAQSYCGQVAVRAAEECVQLHGGIGMTWEHPAHLYLKRAKADQIALGAPGRHREALAALVDLPAP